MTSSTSGSPSGPPLRIGLIGLGRAGVHHLETIRLRSDLAVVAACAAGEPAKASGEAASERPLPLDASLLCRLDELLACDDLDFVLIAAPQHARARLALRAIEAGKNVAIEPPPCSARAEAEALLSAARRGHRRFCGLPKGRQPCR